MKTTRLVLNIINTVVCCVLLLGYVGGFMATAMSATTHKMAQKAGIGLLLTIVCAGLTLLSIVLLWIFSSKLNKYKWLWITALLIPYLCVIGYALFISQVLFG